VGLELKQRRSVLASIAVALLVGGCGGGSATTTSTHAAARRDPAHRRAPARPVVTSLAAHVAGQLPAGRAGTRCDGRSRFNADV